MRTLLDAGALMAVERGDASTASWIKRALLRRDELITHGGVVGQVWRGGAGHQARLARLMPSIDVIPLDDDLGRRAGVLMGWARMSDVVDAALVALARDDDDILTSDVGDLRVLAESANARITLIRV